MTLELGLQMKPLWRRRMNAKCFIPFIPISLALVLLQNSDFLFLLLYSIPFRHSTGFLFIRIIDHVL